MRNLNKALGDTGKRCSGVKEKLSDLEPMDVRAHALNTQSQEITDQTDQLKETIHDLNAEINRLQNLLAESLRVQAKQRPGLEAVEEQDLETELEPESESPSSALPGSSRLIQRLASMVEHEMTWADDHEIKSQLAKASQRAGQRDFKPRPTSSKKE